MRERVFPSLANVKSGNAAHPRESQEMVFDAHDRAFAFFGGACQRGIYDNMKTADIAMNPNGSTLLTVTLTIR